MRWNLFREIGTSGIGYLNHLLHGVGISTIIKNFIGANDVAATITVSHVIGVRHSHIICTQVAVGNAQSALQANHIQCIGKLVGTIHRTIDCQRIEFTLYGRPHRVAHNDGLCKRYRGVSAIIGESIDTHITPVTSLSAVSRIAVRNFEMDIRAAVRNFKIRQFQ